MTSGDGRTARSSTMRTGTSLNPPEMGTLRPSISMANGDFGTTPVLLMTTSSSVKWRNVSSKYVYLFYAQLQCDYCLAVEARCTSQ